MPARLTRSSSQERLRNVWASRDPGVVTKEAARVYVTLDRSKAEPIVAAFVDAGWRARRCEWEAFEVERFGAMLVVEGSGADVLVHGNVGAPEQTSAILGIAMGAADRWRLEVYDEHGTLLWERHADEPGP
jgi:hypothetical protein